MRAVRSCTLLVLVAAAWGLAGCPEEEADAPKPLEGAQPGSLRFVVYLKGDPPDLTEYRKALAENPDEVPEIVEELRETVKAERKDFERSLKAFEGKVVDHWFLTNAVTVEIPAGGAPSLPLVNGVERVEPDRMLQP